MKEFISFDTYAKDAIKLADMIKKTGRTFRSIIVITRGGLFPATILSAQLNIKKIDTYCLASYANKIGGEIQELKKPVIDTEDALFVDDLSDSGNTARYVKSVFPDAFFACVYVKEKGKEFPDLYVKEYPQNTWIIQPWEID
ncbi:MAG: xanthine phosphoribosyltransferase [Succinatimonas sp.]|nr:xanthine phosphoribosyltransferase [Succinatimonas sp.]